ncbi:hypothetical protein CHARACLAT_025652 [Characodon lateralis]|uniref:Uncharacterized protein n=1 Tax=Characodon lateralis TaxID=208331 RepID=A0ABU7DJS6_9TELE|nr:hypothetical protein [Characodon lateralis]
MVQDAYWRYVQKSASTPWEYVEDIRDSPPGQYLCSLIAESIEIIYDFFCNVYTDIVWWTNNFYRKFCHKVDHLEHFMLYLEADLHYHAKELAAQTRSKLEELKECAAHYTEALDPKGLKIALLEKTQELHEHVDKCFKHLHIPHHHHHGHHHDHGHHSMTMTTRITKTTMTIKATINISMAMTTNTIMTTKTTMITQNTMTMTIRTTMTTKEHHDHHDDDHKDHKDHHDHKGHHNCKYHHDHKHHHQHLHGHDHKDPHQHHHGHDHKNALKKKVHESREEFKVTIFSLVYRFEVKLTHTTYSLKKKILPHRRRHWGKLNKASDSLKNVLEYLWEDWAQSQKRTTESIHR